MLKPAGWALAVLWVMLPGAGGTVLAAEEEAPSPADAPAVINAWVVDIPSPATVTGVDGVIVILNKEEKKYELLAPGRKILFDDIVRITSEAALEVTYDDGTADRIEFSGIPEGPAAGAGRWLVFKEQQEGAGKGPR
jgi:hypothetical protein